MKASYDNHLTKIQSQERPVIQRYDSLPEATQRDVREQAKVAFANDFNLKKNEIDAQLHQ